MQEFMGKKWRRGLMVGKRGGDCTPPPTWRLEFPSEENDDNSNTHTIQEFITFPIATSSSVSARKLCANLWQILPHQPHCPAVKMSKPDAADDGDGDGNGGCARMTTPRNHQDKRTRLPRHHDKPASASSLRKHVRALPTRNHPPSKMNDLDRKLVSSTSYTSSLEMGPYKPAFPPKNSLDFKGNRHESMYALKTSTELLTLLNRVWSLEEEHATNVASIKGLKKELDGSQAQIKELLKKRQKHKKEMDELLKQVYENKCVRKNKEMEKIKIAVQSVRKELENERSLRKHSENLQQKLSRQLMEIKCSFSNAEEELEKERRTRILLERLCNEFAKGIREYEHKVRSLSNISENNQIVIENHDPLVLHIAEAWLDDRLRMSSEEVSNDLVENSIADKLGLDIETFLRAKQSVELENSDKISTNHLKKRCLPRHSLDSFQLNEEVSAPQVGANEEYSPCCDTIKLAVNTDTCTTEMKVIPRQIDEKSSGDHRQDLAPLFSLGKQTESQEITRTGNIPSGHLQLEEGTTIQFEDKAHIKARKQNHTLRKDSDKSRISTAVKDIVSGRVADEDCRSDASHVIDSITEAHSLSAQGDQNCQKAIQSAYRGPSSPVKQWMSISSATCTENLVRPTNLTGDNTFKAKLIEARLDGHRMRRIASRSSI